MIDIYFPHIAGVSCSFAILAYFLKLLRVYRKVQVNCWFCNKNTKVQYKFSNSFVCPNCEQYNGFKEDGDYNCIIREQYYDPLKHSFIQPVRNNFSSKSEAKSANGLCEACNLNQALKIRALAEFSAVSSDDNDEVDKFKERLEEIYGLCQHCQATVRQTLGKQNSWLKPLLISWRLMKSKEKSLNNHSRQTKSSLRKLFFYTSLFVCFLLCLLSLEKFSPKSLYPYKKVLSTKIGEIGVVYNYLIWVGLVLQSCIVLFFQDKILKVHNIVSYIGWILLLLVENENDFFSDINVSLYKFLLNIINLFFMIWISTKMFPASSTTSSHKKRSKKKIVTLKSSYSENSFLSDESPSSLTPSSSFATPVDAFEEENDAKKSASLEEDLDADLLSLKISTPKKINSSDFSPQSLFLGNSSNKSSVLQPSKFGKHFITQSSWVAGGYWGSPGSPQRGRLTRHNVSHLEEVKPKPVFSLSRSSSQSSGFVSQLSDCASSRSHPIGMQNLPSRVTPSQQSSLAGDPVDRVSLFSCDRNNSATSFSSLRQQAAADSFEAQSACSVSSYYSDNSQLRYRPSSRSGSCFYDSNHANLSTSNSIVPYTSTIPSSPSYFNLGVAFIMGLSVSANLFLILLWHNDIRIK